MTDTNPFASLIPVRDGIVDQIKAIDVKLAASAGNVAERRTAALEALGAAEDASTDGTVGPIASLNRETALFEAAKLAVEDAKQAVTEAVNGYLRGQKDDTAEASAALKVQRDALLVQATSMETLISGASKPVTAGDLGLKASKSSGSTGGTRAKTSKGTFSHSPDGVTWTTENGHQQSLSSIAYRKFDRASVSQLRAVMAELNGGTAVDETADFETRPTCNGKTFTIKFVVTPVEG